MTAISAPTIPHVLLIDDNETDNFVHKRIIELTGFADFIEVRESVKKAIEYLAQFKNNIPGLPDVIFLDINMPTADGFVFLAQFHDLFPEDLNGKCKIIVLSSSESTRDISRMIGNKLVKEYIHKPLTEESLEKVKISIQR